MGDSDSIFSSGRGKVQAWNGNTEASETMPEAGSYAPTDQYASQPRGGRRARAAKASTPSPVSAGPSVQPAQQTQRKKGNKGCLILFIILVVLFVGLPLLSSGFAFLGVFLDDVMSDDYSDADDYDYAVYADLTEEDEAAVIDAADEAMASITSGEYGSLAHDADYAFYQLTDGIDFSRTGYEAADVADWLLDDCTYELSYVSAEETCVTVSYEVEHHSFYDCITSPYWDASYSDLNSKVDALSQIVGSALDTTETTSDYVEIDLLKNDDGEWVVQPLSVEHAYRTLWDFE